MIQQFDHVMLKVDLSTYGLKMGDVGTIVEIYGDHDGYEVEFIAIEGEQIAVVTLQPNQVSEIASDAISIVSVRQRVK